MTQLNQSNKKKRKFRSERQQVIKEEVNKLLGVGLKKEVQYPHMAHQCGD